MSLFCDNITNEIPILSEGQKFMKEDIYYVVNRYINQQISQAVSEKHPRSFLDDLQEQYTIRQDIIYNWIGASTSLKRFNIAATETLITHSSIKGYKYEVIVNVRFCGETDLENYVEFIRVPIIKDSERKMYECI